MVTGRVPTGKWVDGKQIFHWPIEDQVGWSVETAGRIELDHIRPISGSYNYGTRRVLPPGTKVVLKHIDEKGRAFVYNHDDGVMMMPVELLKPVGK